jgi:hypothetical protein
VTCTIACQNGKKMQIIYKRNLILNWFFNLGGNCQVINGVQQCVCPAGLYFDSFC